MALTRFRLSQLTQSGANNGDVPVWSDAQSKWIPGAGGGGGVTDHGALTGLNDDDHSHYFNNNGRSGGQIGFGGTGAGDNLEFNSTSHATKGLINLGGKLFVNQANGRVGVGTLTPVADFHFVGGAARFGDTLTKWTTIGYVTAGGFDFGFIGASDNGITPKPLIINSAGGTVGIGTGTTVATARFQVRSTAEQLRLDFDATNFVSFTVDAAGDLFLNASGNTIIVDPTDTLVATVQGTVNGVTLTAAGSATNFLNAAGAYVPVSATPGGANREVQFNNAGAFDGNPSIVIDDINGRLGVGDSVGLTTLEFRMHVAVVTDLQGILVDGAVNLPAGQPQILIRKSRGDYTTRVPAFSGDNLGRIAWHGFADDSPDAFKPACEIMTMGLNNPTAGQPFFPTTMTIKVGTFNGVGYVTAISFSGGNNVFVDQPRVSVGNGTQAGNAAFEVTMTSTNEAAIHMHNTAGDAWFGIDSSGNLALTRSGFSVTSRLLTITASQTYFNKSVNNYGFYGEVVVEGDGTGTLFEICREGDPGTSPNIVMVISAWSTAKSVEIYDNGGALWNKQKYDADFIIHGNDDDDVFHMDASANACGFGTATPTNRVDVNADAIRIRGTRSPASSAAGNAGEVCFDGAFGYRCIASGNWARWAITTGY